MYLLLGAIPIIRCSRGTAAEMVAVVRTVFLNTYHCFTTFQTSLSLFSVLDRDLVSLYPSPCEGNKTGKEIHSLSFLISVPQNFCRNCSVKESDNGKLK